MAEGSIMYSLFQKVMPHDMKILQRVHNLTMAGQPCTSEIRCQGKHNILGCPGIKGKLLRFSNV